MEKMKKITVYCGSRYGINPAYAAFAGMLGEFLGKNGFHMIYGGGSIGLMGIVADAAMAAGGNVTGIIPRVFIEQEQAHRLITELIEVPDMGTRKKKLMENSQAFIILPGGIGTLEELSDTLSYLTIYHKNEPYPIFIINIDDFYTPLRDMLRHWKESEFVETSVLNRVHFITTITELESLLISKE